MTKVTFEGIKYSYRQGKDGHVLAFVVHPANMPEYVALAPIGSRVMVTLTEIDEKPTEQPKAEKPRQKWGEMSFATRSGILRNDERFQKWLGVSSAEDAAEHIRWYCGVDSCSKIDGNDPAQTKFTILAMDYRHATGQEAEMRG